MIQEKDFLYRVPVKNVLITTPNKYIRNPEILIDIEGGEFMHGNILDANSTNKLINQSVKDAIDKDNSITDKIDNLKYMPYVSKNNMSSSELGDFTEYQLGATNFIISAMHGSNDARTEFDFGEARFISVSKKSSVDIDYESVTVGNDNNIMITNTGIRKYINRNNPSGSATEAFSTNGGVIDTTAFALKSELDSYAKKTDIPEVDTSDFVSKTTTDNQSIKSGLSVSNNLNVVDGNNESLIDLSIYNTPYDTHTNSSIAVKSFFDGIVDGEQQAYQKGGCMIEMVAGNQRNPYIIISTGTENSYTGESEIKITNSGISQKSHRYDEDTNYYFAANGTVNDIYNTNNKDIYRRFDDIDTSVNNEGVFVSSWNNLTEETEGVRIKNSGISITNGSQNEVFATDGSIADLTKYIKIGDAYKGCIPYYNKYTEREIQCYQLADREGIELSSYGTSTKLLGTDIAISSGSEDLKLTRSGISINSYGGTSNHFYLDVNSQPELNLYDDKCNISAKIFGDGYARIGIRNHNYDQSTYDLKLSADGIEMLSKTTKDIVTANNSTAHIGLDDDQTEYTYVAPLENGKVPAEYLDLSQYVLKSVYDEKIASLESRIAALEANHTTE